MMREARRGAGELLPHVRHYVCSAGGAPMRSKLLNDTDGQRTFAVVLQTGDEAMGCLQTFIEKERISAAQLTGIGALSDARLHYFDWDKKEYEPIPVAEQVEVAS